MDKDNIGTPAGLYMALRTSKAEWSAFFKNIGIPDTYAEEYSSTFSEQQVPKIHLKLISDGELQETYGIALGGHRILIRHSSMAPSAEAPRAPAPSNLVRHKSPQLSPSMSPSSFRAFVSHWTIFKQLVGIPTGSINTAAQLFSLACMDHPEIRRTIADHRPNHMLLAEDEYINMLQNLLTAQATPETYRNKFFSMTQNPGETCQQWLGRLQEVSPDCDFTIRCSNDVNTLHQFDSNLIRSKFILGLYNVKIKQDLLTKSLELSTLDLVVNHATKMEMTARDMAASEKSIAEIHIESDEISSSEDDEVGKLSSYKKSQKKYASNRFAQKHQPKTGPKCLGCGSNAHTSEERAAKCPAWGRNCNKYGKRGHLSLSR